QALPSRKIDRGIGHYITDSDDLFALSLAPRLKDIEWYGRSRRLDPFAIASWWIGYDSPQNDATAEQYFYVHGGPRDPAKWRRAERESDALIRRIVATRAVLRLVSLMKDDAFERIREILALALVEAKLAGLGAASGPLTIFLPSDMAIAEAAALL